MTFGYDMREYGKFAAVKEKRHPIVRWPGAAVALPPVLLAPVGYWALMTAMGRPCVYIGRRWDKRWKAAHRYCVADVNGPLQLTVPILSQGAMHTPWDRVGLSSHGRWWEVHAEALASAYGRTPFYEHYAPSLLRWLSPEACTTVGELIQRTNTEILRLLGLPDDFICYEPAPEDVPGFDAAIYRPLVGATMSPYWQVRADKLGFLPGLSVLDLLFSLGPEAGPYLKNMAVNFFDEEGRFSFGQFAQKP